MYVAAQWPKVEDCSLTEKVPGVDLDDEDDAEKVHMHSNHSLDELKNNTWLSAVLSSYLLSRLDWIEETGGKDGMAFGLSGGQLPSQMAC